MKFLEFGIIFIVIYTILILITHFIFYFFIEKTDFDIIFNTFESSPLFDFEINLSCGVKSSIIFHTWEGRKEKETYYSYNKGKRRRQTRTIIVDRTDIELLNGYKFCYNKIQTYKDLLYNGQIIKQNEICRENYKSCGIIDTLNQILCVKKEENCPLKDIHFGQDSDLNSYTYNSSYNISYNNNNYEGEKKIIGNIILNNGQPCLSSLEKLWKKFSSKEAGDGHLKCKKTIKNVENDERYEDIGQITYKKLYEDNLNKESKEILLENVKDEKVTLYKREFLGIDKICDEKLNISKNSYEKLKKNQKRVKYLFLIESIIMLTLLFILFTLKFTRIETIYYIFSIIFIIFYVIVIICNIVFLKAIQNNDLFYNCSDDITNEFLKNENNNTKKSITIVEINLILDIIAIFLFLIMYLHKCKVFYFFRKKIFSSKNFEKNENNNNEISNIHSKLKPNNKNLEQINEKVPINEQKNENSNNVTKENNN